MAEAASPESEPDELTAWLAGLTPPHRRALTWGGALAVLIALVVMLVLAALANFAGDGAPPPPPRVAATAASLVASIFTIEVTGAMTRQLPNAHSPAAIITSDGPMPFTGSLLVRQADGQIEQRRIDGRVPQTYTLHGVSVAVTFQKGRDAGELAVRVLKNGVQVQAASTTVQYGTVSLTGH